jgi:hypothetical protein
LQAAKQPDVAQHRWEALFSAFGRLLAAAILLTPPAAMLLLEPNHRSADIAPGSSRDRSPQQATSDDGLGALAYGVSQK